MNTTIYDPLQEYESKLKSLHEENTVKFLESLVTQSGVSIEQNRATVREYHLCREGRATLQRKLGWRCFFRVIMCITIVLIPLVITKVTPSIRALRAEIQEADQKAANLLAQAEQQISPLNRLFSDRDALHLIESVLPLMSFADCFSVKQEVDMQVNYDFTDFNSNEQSTIDVLAGSYNDNPFLFENRLVHTMGVETYHGYKTIYWTETYRDSDGKLHTRTQSETLHATVVKPKPYYTTQVVLNYCAQGGPDLSFSRDASHLHQKNDRQIERIVKRGERKLQRKTEKALKGDGDFTSMSNTDFEVLFDALDRNNEVQFRTLFTPLAQTNMVSLIRSKSGYGDDFHFIKTRRTNRIITNHSQGRVINLTPAQYVSYDYDVIHRNFIDKNVEFFKAVYFDFAPLLASPMYQERPVHSLKPIPDYSQTYSLKESEALANAVDRSYVVHPLSKTHAILKSSFIASQGDVDETCITAYSYDVQKQVDFVTMHGGDGRYHHVPVEWDEYLPLEAENHFFIATNALAQNQAVIARRNGLCIYKS